MDVVIYVGIALLLAVILYVVFGKKGDGAAAKPLPPKAPGELGAKGPDARAGAEAKARAAAPVGAPPLEEAERKEKKTEEAGEPAPVSKAAPEVAPVPESGRLPKPPSTREPEVEPTPVPEPAGPSRVEVLRMGLSRSREGEGFFGKLKALFGRKAEISPEIATEIEEVLLASDVGVATTTALLERIREQLGKGELANEEAVWAALRKQTKELLAFDGAPRGLRPTGKPTVVLMVGVNGAGKTTTIGKLATQLQAEGKKCVLAAGDTFRAAAVQQLVVWGERVGCEVVKGKDGSDPGSVVFDAIKRARELDADFVLADTAGRLHTKSNLMSEMQKIVRTIGKAMEGAPHETLLVIDSTNGQNAMAQASEFKQKLDLTGIVLTKLDGTAKGGVVLGIANTLGLPVRFIGLGERPDDLHEFVADDFVEALLGAESNRA